MQPKSLEQREMVRKASTEGIAIQGQQGARLLPEQLLTEAFILSDLFDIGELAALELLLAGDFGLLSSPRGVMDDFLGPRGFSLPLCFSPPTGEHQQPHFPGLTRGLVAVLLYWDGKRCVANSLRSLIQSRHGKTFTLDLRLDMDPNPASFSFRCPSLGAPCFSLSSGHAHSRSPFSCAPLGPFSAELVSLTTRFTDELMRQGLARRILTLVSEISITREFERLQKERGLGNEKHRKEVRGGCQGQCVPHRLFDKFLLRCIPPPPTGHRPHQGVPPVASRVPIQLDLPVGARQGRHLGPNWVLGDGNGGGRRLIGQREPGIAHGPALLPGRHLPGAGDGGPRGWEAYKFKPFLQFRCLWWCFVCARACGEPPSLLCRPAPGAAPADRETVRVGGAQPPGGRPAVEAAGSAGCGPAGLGPGTESSLPAAPGSR